MKNRVFDSIRAYHKFAISPKSCKHCGGPATKDALFDVGNGIAVIERYCEVCANAFGKSS